MKSVYNITKGQLITVWVFGVVGWAWAFDESSSMFNDSFFAEILVWLIPFILIFYTIGWRDQKKKDQNN